jgi:hypothetical protein
MTFIQTHYRTLCPELSILQKYQKTQLWCCRTSRGIANLKTLMHITRSMPLQQQNHEKLQVFHGDTKFKVCRTVHRMFIHLPDPKRTKRPPATSIFDFYTLHKWNKVLLESWRLWKAQATAHICTCSTSTCPTTQMDKKFQFFKHSKLWSDTQAYCKGYA